MKRFEKNYAALVNKILSQGDRRQGRNGGTLALFGESLSFDMSDDDTFPLLVGRKLFYNGVLGELAAMLRGPKHIKDFERFGCNYWKLWGKSDGSINVDYGNLWTNWNGYNQLAKLIDTLRNNPMDRRMIINSWKPDTMAELDLPCCHYSYQWFVRDELYLDMIWTQRSCDTMIGLPSDVILAAMLNILIANQVRLRPGRIKMDLGDTHIYNEHIPGAKEYLANVSSKVDLITKPSFKLRAPEGLNAQEFEPKMMIISRYHPMDTINFKLKA